MDGKNKKKNKKKKEKKRTTKKVKLPFDQYTCIIVTFYLFTVKNMGYATMLYPCNNTFILRLNMQRKYIFYVYDQIS